MIKTGSQLGFHEDATNQIPYQAPFASSGGFPAGNAPGQVGWHPTWPQAKICGRTEESVNCGRCVEIGRLYATRKQRAMGRLFRGPALRRLAGPEWAPVADCLLNLANERHELLHAPPRRGSRA